MQNVIDNIFFSRVCFLFLIITCVSCTNSALEEALCQAGDNRRELEKALEHYAAHPADSLKLKAAQFLIENMPFHYSYGGEYMDAYVHKIDSSFASDPIELRTALYTLPEGYPELACRMEIKPDVQCITAGYLIHNIDLSFKIWQESSWLRELSFEHFCEYLLPYRVGREPLTCWKDSLPGSFRHRIKDASELGNASKDAYAMFKLLKEHLMKDVEYLNRKIPIPDETIGTYKVDCLRESDIFACLWRMCGIPTAIDVFPICGDGNNMHSDIAIIDGRVLGDRGIPMVQGLSAAKVYRKIFSVNRSQILRQTKDYVPPFAAYPFYKDVTSSYVSTADISIKPKTGIDSPEHLYLGVFSLGWQGIAHARIKHGKATFKDVGVGVVYIPFYFAGDRQVFVSNPFYLDADKQMHYFHPDMNNTQTVTFDRKYKIADHKIWWSQLFINGRFEAANDEKFTEPVPIFIVKENTWWRKITVPVDASIQSRYYRFINQGWPCDLAEIHFYDAGGSKLKGRWIGDSTTMGNPELPNVCDGDRLTYAAIQSWVGVDFGRKVTVSRIEYTPRNDANGIYPGMNYELLYFNRDKWESMGVKTATDYFISFEKVPQDALLWLRNLTEGREERIFIYRDGKQIWL